jgi:hypothetical protein
MERESVQRMERQKYALGLYYRPPGRNPKVASFDGYNYYQPCCQTHTRIAHNQGYKMGCVLVPNTGEQPLQIMAD